MQDFAKSLLSRKFAIFAVTLWGVTQGWIPTEHCDAALIGAGLAGIGFGLADFGKGVRQ